MEINGREYEFVCYACGVFFGMEDTQADQDELVCPDCGEEHDIGGADDND